MRKLGDDKSYLGLLLNKQEKWSREREKFSSLVSQEATEVIFQNLSVFLERRIPMDRGTPRQLALCLQEGRTR